MFWSSRIQMEGMILMRNRKIGGENLQDNQKTRGNNVINVYMFYNIG